jgi:hypothetical protein
MRFQQFAWLLGVLPQQGHEELFDHRAAINYVVVQRLLLAPGDGVVVVFFLFLVVFCSTTLAVLLSCWSAGAVATGKAQTNTALNY